jgi:hypothetical protein
VRALPVPEMTRNEGSHYACLRSKGVALLDSETMETVSKLRLARLQEELLGLSMKHFK